MKISIIIPCYNEEHTIQEVIRMVQNVLMVFIHLLMGQIGRKLSQMEMSSLREIHLGQSFLGNKFILWEERTI